MNKTIATKSELVSAGAKFGSFGDEPDFFATLDQTEGDTVQFIKRYDNSYRLI